MKFGRISKKTKVLMILTSIYILILITHLLLMHFELNILVFSIFVSVYRINWVVSILYLFSIGIILSFYRLHWKIRVLHILYTLVSLCLLILFSFLYFIPESKTITFNNENNSDIVILESRSYSVSLDVFEIKNGIFLKHIVSLDELIYSYPLEIQSVEFVDDEFIIVAKHKNNQDFVYIYFEFTQGHMNFLREEVIPN